MTPQKRSGMPSSEEALNLVQRLRLEKSARKKTLEAYETKKIAQAVWEAEQRERDSKEMEN